MSLTLRAYNVLFGDSLLLSWDERDGEHHAWIDFGNFHNDPNAVFEKVYSSVLERTEGKLDMVVITHRHLDHLEGFHSLRHRFAQDYTIGRLFHAHVDDAVDDSFRLADKHIRSLMPAAARDGPGTLGRIYRNNFGALGITTRDRMTAILEVLPYEQAHALHRCSDITALLPAGVRRLGLEVLAPERNSRVYLEALHTSMAARDGLNSWFGAAASSASDADQHDLFAAAASSRETANLLKLADFARIRRQLRTGGLDLLAAVDRTRNNTSLVLRVSYGRKKLLLTGDAEEKSWEVMRANGVSFSSNLVKVGHHGSHNASPDWCFQQAITRRRRSNAVLISTDATRFTGTNEVPKVEVVHNWTDRLSRLASDRLLRTDSVPAGEFVEINYR